MYTLLDSGAFQKLEQIGKHRIIRPAPQALWRPARPDLWDAWDARFERTAPDRGTWHFSRSACPREWNQAIGALTLRVKLTGFGHLGIFPEQQSTNRWIRERIARIPGSPEVLNLFAYTGWTTLAAAAAGARVTHLDAAKGVVDWARRNARLSGLENRPIRWIVDDVNRFVKRETQRKRKYDAILLDPPSFGRGPKKEIWKLEEHLPSLLDALPALFSERFAFMALSAHTPGMTPLCLENLLRERLPTGSFASREMILREKHASRPLPSGAAARWSRDGGE
jgi:23S rRNA (cytosine1962-C5)-methyltransferase